MIIIPSIEEEAWLETDTGPLGPKCGFFMQAIGQSRSTAPATSIATWPRDSKPGSYFMMEALVPPGGGPPPHIQTREEEGFYILEGSVTFWADGNEVEAGPGTFLHVPRGALHNFRNQSEDAARMLIWFAPAGIETMFSMMAKEPERYNEIAADHGVEFPDST